MGDEEKTIEQIIAELEGLEKQKAETKFEKKLPELPEELTLERDEELTLEAPAETSPDAGTPVREDIFAEKPADESGDDLSLEEPREPVILEETRSELVLDELKEDPTIGELPEEIALEEPKEILMEELAEGVPPEEEYEDIFKDGGASEPPHEELTLERNEELTLEAPAETSPGAGDPVREDVFAEKPADKPGNNLSLEEPGEDTDLEEPPEELVLEEAGGEPRIGEYRENIVREEPQEIVMNAPAESDSSEEKFVDIFEEETPESSREELTLEESPAEEIAEDKRAAVPDADVEGEGALHPEPPFDPVSREGMREETIAEEPSRVPREMASSAEPFEEPFSEDEGEDPDEPDEPPAPPQRTRTSLKLVLLFLVLVALTAYGLLVWPTLYREGTFITAGKQYQMRINRITKAEQYYEAGTWHSMPLPQAPEYRAPIKVGKKTPTVPMAKKEETVERQPVAKVPVKETAEREPKIPVKVTIQAVPQIPEPTAGTTEEVIKKAPAEVVEKETKKPPVESEKKIPPKTVPTAVVAPQEKPMEKAPAPPPEKAEKKAEPAEEKTVKKEPAKPEKSKQYIIQVGSMRFREFAEDIVETLENRGMDAHMDIVKSKKTGVWYRVFIRGFETRKEAAVYMKDKNLGKTYPGSFVQVMSLSPQSSTRD